jgi:hypothetical protein
VSVTERRKYPRYIFRADVEIEWGSQILRVPISEINLGGMFIATRDPLWVVAEFAVRLLLEEPLHLYCVVRQVVPGRGMAIEFLDLADASRAKLEKLLEALAVR